MNSIELKRLTKTFPAAGRVVDDISFSIKPGEFITLLGPSGCGKTTTLRLIAGFEFPDQGTILVNGIDVTELPPYRRPVNTVFQDYALFPHMTIAQNVGYGLRIAGLPGAEISRKVADALLMVGLSDKAAARPSQLSGGQRQRVALARAIVREPKVLLLDEPLSALDAKLRETMQVELRQFHKRLGITFLLVTHDQTEAMVLSDRILVMDKGRVVQDGSPADLYNNPVSPYVANFVGTSNLIAASVLASNGKIADVKVGDAHLSIPLRGHGFAANDEILLAIRPEKAALHASQRVPSRAASGLAATVLEHFFHGNTMRTSLDIGTGTPFLVDTQLGSRREFAALPKPKSKCRIEIDEDSVIAFAAAQGR